MRIDTLRGLVGIAVFVTAVVAHAQSSVNLSGAEQISSSESHTCAVTAAGEVFCWGSNGHGELGDGSLNDRTIAGRVLTLSGAVSVSAGAAIIDPINFPSTYAAHTCAVLASGGVKCWGSNSFGELGDGTIVQRTTPVDVVGLAATMTAIAAGGKHTCALTSAGGVKCWGANDRGQLGDGTTASRPTPTDVTGLTSGVVAIAAGYRHSCALLSTGGVRCWGANDSGQIGDGTATTRLLPANVSGLTSGVAAIAAGGGGIDTRSNESGSETCAALQSGGAKCWGHGATAPLEKFAAGSGVVGISTRKGSVFTICGPSCTSFIFTACVVRNTGGVQCWGGGDAIGTTPTDLTGLAGPVSDVVTGGGTYVCALLQSGNLQCKGGHFPNQPTYVVVPASGRNPQATSFAAEPPDIPNVGDSITVSVNSGGSSSPPVVSSLTPSICTVSGFVVTGVAQGKCTLALNQAGDANYDPAPQVTASLRVGDPLPQTITFGPAPSVSVGGSARLSATASSGLEVFFFSNTPSTCDVVRDIVTGKAPGTCTVAASQGGGTYYQAAPLAVQNITVTTSPPQQRLLRVWLNAAGRVTSSPAGIDCVGDGATVGNTNICYGLFASGSVVTLTASGKAGPDGTVFFRWSPTGSNVCPYSTSRTCSLTMDAATKEAEVDFLPYTGQLAVRYRLYSPTTFEHLYTTDSNEYAVLPSCCGWTPEGAIYNIFQTSGSTFNGATSTPLYRLYNPFSHQHHWTTDLNEYNFLPSVGWNQEGVDGHILGSPANGALPLYRLYLNAQGGLHLWTTDESESAYLIANAGWVSEGITGYVIPLQ